MGKLYELSSGREIIDCARCECKMRRPAMVFNDFGVGHVICVKCKNEMRELRLCK